MAAIRGRRPSRATPAHTSRCQGTQSPSPSRCQPPSPTSSYMSAISYAPAAENWTMAVLCQVLSSSSFIVPSRSTKPDLLALYASLQSGELSSSSPPCTAGNKASQGRSIPNSQPEQITTPSGTGLRLQQKAFGKPRPRQYQPHPPPRATEHQLVTHPGEEPDFVSTSRSLSVSTPPLAAPPHTRLVRACLRKWCKTRRLPFHLSSLPFPPLTELSQA